MSQVWIVDDEPAICLALRTSLEADSHRVRVFSAAEPLIKQLELASSMPDVLLLDIRLPGMSGLDALQMICATYPNLPVIVMTAFGDLQSAVNAIQGRAFEYLTKPFELETALQTIHRALAQRSIAVSNIDEQVANQLQTDLLLGTSVAMQSVYKRIAIAASRETAVLVEGERGTGKSVVAAMIHRFSPRSNAPFLSISSIADRLGNFDVELFGAKSADLSQSSVVRTGMMELAGNGTLVVDEIGLIPIPVQAKLLSAIESGTYVPVMDSVARKLSCRIMFTTVNDIDRLKMDGELTEQFHSHLQVYRIALPPLRDRREDIAPMVQSFLNQTSMVNLQFSQNAMRELERRDWPGNVRELRQTIQRAAMASTGRIIQLEDLPTASNSHSTSGNLTANTHMLVEATRHWLAEQLKSKNISEMIAENGLTGTTYDDFLGIVEPPLIEKALEELHGNRAAVSTLLGMHRSTLRQKMKRYGIE